MTRISHGYQLGQSLQRDPEYWTKLAEEFRHLSLVMAPSEPHWSKYLYNQSLVFEDYAKQAFDNRHHWQRALRAQPRQLYNMVVEPHLVAKTPVNNHHNNVGTKSVRKRVRLDDDRLNDEPFLVVVGTKEYKANLRKSRG